MYVLPVYPAQFLRLEDSRDGCCISKRLTAVVSRVVRRSNPSPTQPMVTGRRRNPERQLEAVFTLDRQVSAQREHESRPSRDAARRAPHSRLSPVQPNLFVVFFSHTLSFPYNFHLDNFQCPSNTPTSPRSSL